MQEVSVQDTIAEPVPVSENLSRLEELRKAEKEALERVTAIQALPSSERTGLMSAMKELKRIREEMKSFPDNHSAG